MRTQCRRCIGWLEHTSTGMAPSSAVELPSPSRWSTSKSVNGSDSAGIASQRSQRLLQSERMPTIVLDCIMRPYSSGSSSAEVGV
eukprot:1338702-Rhodomonas_salina.4